MKSLTLIASLVALAMAAGAYPADSAWPRDSAGQYSVLAIAERFRIHVDSCSVAVPTLKSELGVVMASLDTRVMRIGDSLLASDAFGGMKLLAVPNELSEAMKESFEEEERGFRALNLVEVCPKTLQNYRSMTDDELRAVLTQALAAIRNGIEAFKKARGQ